MSKLTIVSDWSIKLSDKAEGSGHSNKLRIDIVDAPDIESIVKNHTKVSSEHSLDFGNQMTADGTPVKIVHDQKDTYLVLRVPGTNNEFDTQYKANVARILNEGENRTDRTGVNTRSIFGRIRHEIDLRLGFPATTLKKLAFKTMKVETIDWMLKGKFDLKTLKDKGVRIWDQNVKPGTEVYGEEYSVEERLKLLTPGQKENFNSFREELLENHKMSSTEYEETFHMKLNNWGVPERPLIDGDLGPIYGKQWRSWEDIRIIGASELYDADAYAKYGARGFMHTGHEDVRNSEVVIRREIDQVADLEKAMASRSDSRRIILTGWNVAQLDEMSLPPCHTMAQWYVSQNVDGFGKPFLDVMLFSRSLDVLLGCPFNIAQYAMLTHMLAHVHGLTPRFMTHTIGDAHLYKNHIDPDPETGASFVQEILDREIRFASANIKIEGEYKSILDIPIEAVSLVGYESYEAQKNVPIAK